MQWVLDNWVWVLFGGGMIAMHIFGHGGHGGRGGKGKSHGGDSKTNPESQPGAPSAAGPNPKIRDHAGESIAAEKHRDL